MNVTDALAAVEGSIAAGELGDASAGLAQVAAALLELPPDPVALAHATWLGGVVALQSGDQAAFERFSRDAVQVLRLAGDDAWAATVLASRDELIAQLADVRAVQRDGAAGVMAVLGRHYQMLRDIAAGDGWDDARWATVSRRRALLPALIALVEITTGTPAPLAQVLEELECDPIDSVLLATLAAATEAGDALLPIHLARLCFADSLSVDRALLALRDNGRLAVGQALAANARGELHLSPAMMQRLYGGA